MEGCAELADARCGVEDVRFFQNVVIVFVEDDP